ncbi:MAG: hypothetical protein ACLVHY_06840 [Gemmiger sp.]
MQVTGTAGEPTTSESRSQSLRRTVEQFDEKDKFEFAIDPGGCTGNLQRHHEQESQRGGFLSGVTGPRHGRHFPPDGERVMAVTELVPYAAGNVAAMRLVPSLTLVDRQWWQYRRPGGWRAGFRFGAGCFVRSIVRPWGKLKQQRQKLQKAICTPAGQPV